MIIDYEKIKRQVEELKAKREQREAKAGFCVIKPDQLKAPFAREVLERFESEVGPFLKEYAQLVAETGEWVPINDGSKTKLIEWRDSLNAISRGHSEACGRAFRYVAVIGKIAGNQEGDPLFWAEWIYKSLEKSNIRCSTYEAMPEDYTYDYDEELTKIKEAHKLWVQELERQQSFA